MSDFKGWIKAWWSWSNGPGLFRKIVGYGMPIFIVLIIVGAISGGSEETSTDGSSDATGVGVDAPASVSWAEAELTEPTVTKALADAKQMTRSLNLGKPIALFVEDGIITATYEAKDALKETDLLTIGAHTSFSAFRVLFQNPAVQDVSVVMQAEWTDSLGKTAMEQTTILRIVRGTADKIGWDGLEDRVTLDNKHLFCIADTYRIHGGIYSRLGDKGCLTSPSRSQ